MARGAELFSSRASSPAATNLYACATCHATQAPTGSLSDAPVCSGASLEGVVGRAAYWGGAYTDLLDAVNACRTGFMGAPAYLPADLDGRALYVYLASLGGSEPSAALPFGVVANVVVDPSLPGYVPSGDAARGAAFYVRACARCHGEVHTGRGRLGEAVPILPDATLAAHGSDPRTGARAFTVEKVRHGRYYGVGGTMPLYCTERLSDGDLGDLLAFFGF